jgi:apolipoprotein N-acyltransferase
MLGSCPAAGSTQGSASRASSIARVRSSAVVLGVILVLVGLVWIGQGLGYVTGSFMTGAQLWAWIGAAAVLAGIAVIFLSLRLRPRR